VEAATAEALRPDHRHVRPTALPLTAATLPCGATTLTSATLGGRLTSRGTRPALAGGHLLLLLLGQQARTRYE
jgi:hypothetical protein